MADFASAEDQALAVPDLGVLDHRLEAAGTQVAERASRIGMPQHPFGSKNNERLAPATQRLTAQQMEILAGSRGLANLNVVLGRELKVSFNACARVLRSLAFITVRQEHHQSGKQSPFVLAGNNELINDDLRSIGKVAELRFPQHQGVWIIAAEAVLKSQDCCF